MLSGEYVIFVEGRDFVCPAGSFMFIPKGMPHGFRVGRARSRKLNLYSPAAMVGYFDGLAAALKADNANDEAVAEIARRYAMEVVGPVPEGYV